MSSRAKSAAKKQSMNTRSRSAAKIKKIKDEVTSSEEEQVVETRSPPAKTKQTGKSVADRNRSSNKVQSPDSAATRGKRKSQEVDQSVIYEKNTYVAFIDSGDSLEYFKIGLIVQDLKEDDKEALLDIYGEVGPLEYQREVSKIPVEDYTIICDVVVTLEKGAKRGQPKIKITKQQFNKIVKLKDATVKRIQEEENNEDEEDEEDLTDSEEEEEEEEDEVMEKDNEDEIKNRRLVRGRQSVSVKTAKSQPTRLRSAAKPKKATAQEEKSVSRSGQKSEKANQIKTKETVAEKKGVKKASARKSTKVSKEDEDMDEEKDEGYEEPKDEESSEKIVMIDTSKSKNRRQPAKSQLVVPQVGQKRLRTSKKKAAEGSNQGSQVEGDEDDDEPVKKRKIGEGKAKPEKKLKVKKMPTEFKKGKWNPDVQLVEEDKYKESPSNQLFLECCIRCSNKNIIRAAITRNEKLLKAGISAENKISNLIAFWSPDNKFNSIDKMVENNDHQMLEILLKPKVHVPLHSTEENERNNFFQKRVNNPSYLIQLVDSGMVSHMAYGTRVRKVQQSRGNRQGNNAFLEYVDNPQKNPIHHLTEENFLRKMLYNQKTNYETFKALYKLGPHIESTIQIQAYEAVRAGNRVMAYEIINNMVKFPNFGFNQLHAQVLGDGDLEKFVKQSVTKKSQTNKDITPLHCACINPNPKYLKALLEMGPDLETIDSDLRRPIHYAAACEGPEPLKILLEQGASLNSTDNKKTSAIHIAAITGRDQNVKMLLAANPGLLNFKDKKSMTAMAYACKYGHRKVVEVLLAFKARINATSGLMRMTPLCWAACYGHYDLCHYLLENKARVLGKDKFKRTPLILAVRNGHTKIASLLLQRGSEWDHMDSSNNTALHYAAGYGWIDCLELLLKAGSNVNTQNSWKISPINIAMLMGHIGCVKRLLEEPNVDVNGKDEKGRTLLILSLIVLDDESIDFISYLLKKGADPNIADLDGNTALHYLAQYQPKGIDHQGVRIKALYQKEIEIQKKIAQIIIQHDGDLSKKNNKMKTPFTLCLTATENPQLLEYLQDKISINNEPELFFSFSSKIFNEQYQKIFMKILQNEKPTQETINYLDDDGQTPFLVYLNAFNSQYDNLFQMILCRVNQQSFKFNQDRKRYQITNEDIFELHADTNNFYNYNSNFSQEEKMALSKEFMDEIIVKPFINLLQVLIENGADPKARVQKLKYYRGIEEQKRIQIQLLAEGKEIPVEKEDPIKKREEKLDELRARKVPRKKMKSRFGRNPFGGGGVFNNNFNNFGILNQVNNPNSDGKPAEIYDMIDGEKVLREYNEKGLKNAIHYIIQNPQMRLFNFLISLGINPDEPDYDLTTPFNQLSKVGINSAHKEKKEIFDKLLDMEVRIDFPNRRGATPFLNFYEKSDFNLAYQMLAMGANVNQMDTSGLFALKYALIRRQNDRIQELIDKGANINQIDNKGRNLLHHAINMSSATADATFETEQFLIERGIEINLRDNKNRTPLHYAFVKISNWQNNTQIDPIETVSSLCGCKGLEIDVADLWQKTPLHYASQRGASICAMYMIARGSNIEAKDIYGNTPLGVGLMNRHYNYGIILIQKLAQVFPLVYREDHERIKKQWEEEKKKQEALYKKQKRGSKVANGEDEEMKDEDEENKPKHKRMAMHRVKAHQDMFNHNGNKFVDDYYSDGDDDEDYDDEDDEDDYYQEQVFNQQNAFGMQVFGNQTRAQPAYGGFGGGLFNNKNNQNQITQAANTSSLILDQDKEGVSMFKLAIRGGQQGLAYLMIDNGYDLMHAMQDAMDEKKFMLVLTLLSKNPDDSVIQSKNKKGQNLFHILSMNAGGCSIDHLKRIYETLSKRGVDTQAKDSFGRTALHYAVISGAVELVKMLLSHGDGYNPNEVDQEGHTPLSLCLRGGKIKTPFYNPQFIQENIFYLLVKNGADVNFVYPEETYKPCFKEEEVDEQHMHNYDPKGPYHCSLLVHLVRQNGENEQLRNSLIGLIEFGAKLDVVDSDGRDPIMYAIINNNTMVVKLLLENKKALKVDPNAQDKSGKSAVHYVVQPIRYGTFENIEILNLLNKFGYNMKLKDADGKTPAHYAAMHESRIMLNELAKLTGRQEELERFNRQLSMIDTQAWPEQKVDFEQDSEQFMIMAQEREHQRAKDEDKRIPVDKTGKFERSYQVYYDDQDKPWDVYLTKVDLKNGIYGDYVFYKMQLLYDSNRDLYVVFTRWGRIGEPGMNQRSPFNDVEDAKTEFKKIFKSKTGGNNFEELDKFSRVKKKYNLTRVNYVNVNYQEYLQPFDYEKSPRSKLTQDLYDLFEEISNITMYQKAITQCGIDTSVLPFSGVKKESLVEARQVLTEIQECIKEDIEISKDGIKADYDKLCAVKEKISELSSRYYELIPLERYKNQIAPPLRSQHQIKEQYDMLENLTNIEYASKVLLGALFKQKEMNPIDYVYNALNIQIEFLEPESPEFEVINTYINNTKGEDQWSQMMKEYEVSGIFKVQRKGEAEMIQAFKEIPNHYLLFHGSTMSNFIGIMKQGLRIAPPEAPTTGFMFGKGVYFADMFQKSFAYSARGYQAQDSYLMLMCEVVLGKSKELHQAEYVEKLEPIYHSVKGCGQRGPGYKHTITMPNGVKVPYGKVIEYHAQDFHKRQMMHLAHNEYIVYNTSQIRMRYLIQVSRKKQNNKQKK